MASHRKNIILVFCALALLVLYGVFYISWKNPSPPSIQESDSVDALIAANNEITISLSIGEKKLKLTSKKGSSLYEILLERQKESDITLSGKNYPGLGFLVTDIDTLHTGNGKYLFYYINGKEASVGVSSYFPQEGDAILWKLK